ncbi:MAG: methionine sulfoxide reductase heme-binding subunit [Thermoleophilaceae bacterium]|nr:methionine sulfoxide reductase heme-binding subunit [Thermoleophilaceae bacterium]
MSGASAYWYLTRGTGIVALLLLTLGLVLGVMGPTRFRTARLPRFVVSGLHRNVTLLAFVFVVVHVVTTILDGYTPIGVRDAFVPFAASYRPFWLGLGAVALDLLVALIVTSLLRNRLGFRAWRAVHWLAYASWPVALLHALGTGSDARSAWMVALAVVCTIAVIAAVAWRVGKAAHGGLALGLGAGAGAVALSLLALVWYQGGPGQAGWAKRAGTPTALISSSAGNAALTTSATAGLPQTPFTAPLDGKFAESGTDANGLVAVAVTGLAGGGVDGELHLDLWGQPLGGGGVSMTASRVRFGPSSAPSQYTGSINSLSSQRIVASLSDASGRPLTLTLDLQIHSASGTVSGTLQAQSSTGASG